MTTDVGALANDWATDAAVLARLLNRLRQWGEPAEPLAQQTIGRPEFDVTCRRADPTGPLIDITLPANFGRSPVVLSTAAVPAAGRNHRKEPLMAKHRLVPPTTGRRRVHTIDLVDTRDLLTHLLTSDALAAGLRPKTDYVALCGAVVFPAPLVEPGGRSCWGCKSATVTTVPSQRSR